MKPLHVELGATVLDGKGTHTARDVSFSLCERCIVPSLTDLDSIEAITAKKPSAKSVDTRSKTDYGLLYG